MLPHSMLVTALLSMPVAGVAQSDAILRGVVRTTGAGTPLEGISVIPMAWGDTTGNKVPDLVSTDSAGAFILRSGYSWSLRLSFVCPKGTTPFRLIATRMARFELGKESYFTLDVPEDYCASQPHIELRRLFAGWYVAEFEGSSFQACPDEPVPLTLRYRASALDTVGFWGTPVWVELTQRAAESLHRAEPPAQDRSRNRWFVRWYGTLQGPGEYGHMNSSNYLLNVDSIATARTPGPGDCKRPT